MKLLVLLSFLFVFYSAGAQNLSWFHGDWIGETYFPNGPVTKRIIVKLHVLKVTGNRFEATLENFYPNDTTVRLKRAITGQIANKKLVIESSLQTYILDPRTQSFWHDCSGCEIQSGFSFNSDKIEIKIQTANCGNECNGETLFSRDTSNLNTTQQNDLAQWFHLPMAKPIAKTTETGSKESAATTPKAASAQIKTDTTIAKKITAKDTTSVAHKKQPENETSATNKSSKTASIPVRKKSGEDSILAKAKQPASVKKDNLAMSVASKVDSIPGALTARTTNLVTTYQVSSPHIVIQLFDNAEIDGDVVTVYHNGQLIIDRQSLTHKAITITVNASKTDAHHEFIMVADNLGLIAPNTALMRITAGDQKLELEVSSDFNNNSKIAIDYTGE